MRNHALSLKKLKRYALILPVGLLGLWLAGCGYIAAGAAGAAVGHEIAEERDEDDEDRD